MGWFSENRQHEGWIELVAAGNRSSSSAGAGGMLAAYISNQDGEPEKEITGWRGACSCGWRGRLCEQDANPADDDVRGSQDKISNNNIPYASRGIEYAVHHDWKAHLPPRDPIAAAALAAVKEAANECDQASERLDSMVAYARAAGASWATIGRAAGFSRQSAYKRWAEANPTPPC